MLTEHRYPILLIDKILEKEDGVFLKAIKNVSLNEKIFMGHFPGNPIFPGIYTIEGLCQCAQILAGSKKGVTAKLDSFKFYKPILPGDQINYEVKMDSKVGQFTIIKAKAFINGKKAVQGTITGYDLE